MLCGGTVHVVDGYDYDDYRYAIALSLSHCLASDVYVVYNRRNLQFRGLCLRARCRSGRYLGLFCPVSHLTRPEDTIRSTIGGHLCSTFINISQ